MGLGVGAGFLGGAMVGVAAMSVYHRYQMYRNLMYMNQYGGNCYMGGYCNNYYHQGICMGGCPMNARCEYGFCECIYGFRKSYGQCYREGMGPPSRPAEFDPFRPCTDSISCQTMDLNLVCNKNLTTSGAGRCECRQDMKWNKESLECQIYLDVDCSNITYDTPPSTVVLKAANLTLEHIQAENITTDAFEDDDNSTISAEESLENSLLSNIDPKVATDKEITEAFCRDIDSFSFEFAEQQNTDESDNEEIFGGIVGLLILVIGFCCVIFLIRKCMMKAKAAMTRESNNKPMTGVEEIPMGDGVINNPGFIPQQTPIHSQVNDPYCAQPSYVSLPPADNNFQNPYGDPAPIPPTQPGYTNTMPTTNPQVPYPAQPIAQPYPPQPTEQPYPPAIYQQAMPYPPASQGYTPYPPQPIQPYTSTNSAQPLPYPPNINPPPYNPSAPM